MPPAFKSRRAGRASSALVPIQPSSRSWPTRSSSVVRRARASATTGSDGGDGEPAVDGDGPAPAAGAGAVMGEPSVLAGDAGATCSPPAAGDAPEGWKTGGACGLMRGALPAPTGGFRPGPAGAGEPSLEIVGVGPSPCLPTVKAPGVGRVGV